MDKNGAEKEMKGVQLRLTGKKSELNEMLCISGIPHFAIIDPAGKLVWNGLPGCFLRAEFTGY